jgi:hypothetical protein
LKRAAVDQKGRRALNALGGRLRRFVIDQRNSLAVIDALVKARGVETDIGGVFFQVRFGVRADIFAAPFAEQFVVILPKLALRIRALGGIGSPMRFTNFTLIDYGVIAIRELDFAGLEIILIELALRAKRKIFAVRSLIVGILD